MADCADPVQAGAEPEGTAKDLLGKPARNLSGLPQVL
jgi:hypothetical protein